jgi:caspase domain-containing protein/putative peptidoglycan binding protein
MNKLSLSTVALAFGVLFAGAGAQPALAEKRVALVIGNSAYQHAPALPNPARDAKAMVAMFERGGFTVVTAQYDAGNLQFKRTIRQFEDAASDADIAVIYYAGHGIEIHGTNYLIPVDAKLASDRDADDEAITLDRLVEAADGAKRLRLVILDACRDNPFVKTMKRQRTASLRGVTAGLAKVEPTGTNTLIAFAAKGGAPAEDGEGDHSPFTTALLDHLFVPGLDVRLAFGRARDEVLKKTSNRQEPYVYGSLGGTSIAVVPAQEKEKDPSAVAAVSEGEKGDYQLVEKIGTKGAWEVFLAQHPKGFYADLARQQITKLAMAETGSGTVVRSPPAPPSQQLAAVEPPKPPKVSGPSSEEQREWDKIKNSSNAEQFREFIRRYPASPLANLAQSHLEAIEAAARERDRLAAEREQKARLEAQRKEEAKRQAEQEAALKRAREEAKAAEEARAKAEREAARKREEEERQRQLDEAARAKQVAEAEAKRLKAEQAEREAARRAREEARSAEEARTKAEREAARKREEEERQRQLAEAARTKQAAEAEAKRLKAEQAEREAALKRAQEEAKAAEAARAKAEREATLKRDEEERQRKAAEAEHVKQEACRREEDRFTALQARGDKAADGLKQLERELTCARLRPVVVAALKRATAEEDVMGSERVRAAQKQLARLGCYDGVIDGSMGDGTKAALERYLVQQRRPGKPSEVSEALLNELKSQPTRVCPLACPIGQVAEGDECVAEKKSTPIVREKDDEEKPSTRRHTKRHEERSSRERRRAEEKPAPRHENRRADRSRNENRRAERSRNENRRAERPQPRVRQEARRYGGGGGGGGGGGHGTTIGVGF